MAPGVVMVVVIYCLVVLMSSRAVSGDQIMEGIIPLNSTLFANATTNDQTSNSWLSANATFVLGFFTPASARSSGSSNIIATVILAIWFQNISSLTVVWMANRDSPVDAHSYFRLTTAGQFALLNGSGVVVWSTPSYRGMRSDVVRGEFQQSGNLQLQNQTSKDVLWQSFDHPTDTLLPGQQFSRTTNALRSWRSLSDASTGNF
ncbi:hypothetical protein L7F22_024190 [Adiantum nelumboides]|nr:hypothetical protein [Adiantum nelumboides]